jgi:pimeloyl-ACP methyl ester carboxylesterase
MHIPRSCFFALAVTAAGCGSSAPPSAPRPVPPAHRTPAATARPAEVGTGGPTGAHAVGFAAGDGVELRGRLFGSRRAAAVVLVHMGNRASNEADWYGLARRLRRAGYLVLTYNRRGICSGDEAEYDCSGGTDDDWGKSWQDVVGAVRFVQARGARRVAVIGASLGASSALYAAKVGQIRPVALITLGGVNFSAAFSFKREDLRAIAVPKLFVSARKDPFQAERSARLWYGWASGERRLALLPSSRHGTDMLAPSQPTSGPLTRLIMSFLRGPLAGGRYT